MKLFKLTLAIAIAFMAISYVDGTAAYGDTFRTLGSGGDWNNDRSWEELVGEEYVDTDDHPEAGDTATIQSGDTIIVDFADEGGVDANIASAAVLTVNNGGTLNLEDDGQLELGTALTINGLFKFNQASGGGAVQPILRATDALVIDGNIDTVSGRDLGGRIEMDAMQSVRLASGTISSEHGPIDIEADFDNRGTVEANGTTNGFDVTFTGAIAAGSTGLFQVTAANSDMIFNLSEAATITSGADFLVTDGRMFFQEDVETDGGYQQTGGTIEVEAANFFKATGAFP